MKKIEFVNKVVKQGNSLCVRIPNTIKKELDLSEGIEIIMSITKQDKELYKYNEKNIQYMLDMANKVKKLDKYKEMKKRFFIILNYKFLEETISDDSNEMKKRQIKFIKEKKKEFGSKLIEEFIKFSTIFNKEAFITEKGGMIVPKSKYR